APAPAVAAPAASAPTTATAAGPDFRPKPFTPAPPEPPAVEKPGAVLFEQQGKPASAGPAAAPGAKASPAAQPAPAPGEAAAPGERAYFTFEVGEFAHAASGKELMAALEAKGFSTRMDQAKRNNKTFYKVFAGKEGSRAALEAELFGDGVTEPRLAEERPAGSAPAGKAAASAPAPAAAPAAKAQPAAGPKVSAPIAPPIVEPAPPLPDGYVPPPKKTGS
ncbi:SPOR domain-containing protein, partial [Solidesulfovibrio sp.]|uniref:SPOR domain-containing protein n=1 Tax=Solidesulfovibrio sp. TaxID=2910990 RepID=UPI002614E0AE